jgi:hypothetical protein
VVLLDTSYDAPAPAPQHRVVLVEEFTGVHCSNCPPGHAALLALLAAHPDSVLGVSIHNNHPLAEPFDPPAEDFRTPEGIAISQSVLVSGIPTGVVDRKDFDSDGTPTEGWPFWDAKVKQQLLQAPPVNVDVTVSSYTPATRELIVKVKLHYTSDVTADQSISVMITESDIVNPQVWPDLTVDEDYIHNHILRDMLTPSGGDPIDTPTPTNRVIEREFYLVLGEHWNPANCEVIAFVHERAGFREVIQAAVVHVL